MSLEFSFNSFVTGEVSGEYTIARNLNMPIMDGVSLHR
jgi:hypothetical protein